MQRKVLDPRVLTLKAARKPTSMPICPSESANLTIGRNRDQARSHYQSDDLTRISLLRETVVQAKMPLMPRRRPISLPMTSAQKQARGCSGECKLSIFMRVILRDGRRQRGSIRSIRLGFPALSSWRGTAWPLRIAMSIRVRSRKTRRSAHWPRVARGGDR